MIEKGDKVKGRTLDLRVTLASEMDPDWKPPAIHITKDNALLRRQFDVSRNFNSVYINTFESKDLSNLWQEI